MAKKSYAPVEVTLEKIIGGGQTLGALDDGRKLFVWGGLPGERVRVQITKRKSNYAEGVVTDILEPSTERIAPIDPESYLSTSPWQIMTFEAEQRYKSQLIDEAFAMHHAPLALPVEIYSNGREYGYRNKVEFSFWFDTDTQSLSLAFFRRGTHGKISVNGTSLAHRNINQYAQRILTALNHHNITGRSLKTLLMRCDSDGKVAWQLYVKEEDFPVDILAELLSEGRGEIIFSNPKSPASVITTRLTPQVEPLSDTILNVPFRYATEGFFQINLPVYEQALRDMQQWVEPDKPVLDLYSGVGSIGLTIGGDNVTLVEINEHAVREMRQNIETLGSNAEAILAASENALDFITADKTIIVDPPRAGLHQAVVDRLLEVKPARIIYLSCNPVTQARDVALLAGAYKAVDAKGYNFFPRTPHIEHLVVLDVLQNSK